MQPNSRKSHVAFPKSRLKTRLCVGVILNENYEVYGLDRPKQSKIALKGQICIDLPTYFHLVNRYLVTQTDLGFFWVDGRALRNKDLKVFTIRLRICLFGPFFRQGRFYGWQLLVTVPMCESSQVLPRDKKMNGLEALLLLWCSGINTKKSLVWPHCTTSRSLQSLNQRNPFTLTKRKNIGCNASIGWN